MKVDVLSSAHYLKQLTLTMAMKFIIYWQKLTDILSLPTSMLHTSYKMRLSQHLAKYNSMCQGQTGPFSSNRRSY